MKKLLLTILIISIFSCKKDEEKIDYKLIGTWSYAGSTSSRNGEYIRFDTDSTMIWHTTSDTGYTYKRIDWSNIQIEYDKWPYRRYNVPFEFQTENSAKVRGELFKRN